MFRFQARALPRDDAIELVLLLTRPDPEQRPDHSRELTSLGILLLLFLLLPFSTLSLFPIVPFSLFLFLLCVLSAGHPHPFAVDEAD